MADTYIFDFDSTMVSIETLDAIVKDNADAQTDAKVDDITRRCMNGEIDFHESITTRLKIARVHSDDFTAMAERILDYITEGIDRAIRDLLARGDQVLIISGGFVPIVLPIARALGIPEENCFANTCVTDNDGFVTGVDNTNPLAYEGGKNKLVQQLRKDGRLPGKVTMIGDGMSDCKVYLDGLADDFIGCGFWAVRPAVRDKSPLFVTDADGLYEAVFKP
ncbi:MAG: HAD-IB family phosphatase [Alphaproteobacteria bacterium]|nr:HAD-IB family phosphatase [Alphaproteobacteria bacterium]